MIVYMHSGYNGPLTGGRDEWDACQYPSGSAPRTPLLAVRHMCAAAAEKADPVCDHTMPISETKGAGGSFIRSAMYTSSGTKDLVVLCGLTVH